VTLTTHPLVVQRLRKEYRYTPTPSLVLHGLLKGERYLYHTIIVAKSTALQLTAFTGILFSSGVFINKFWYLKHIFK